MAVTAWPRRSRVRLGFVALKQSSDRGPVSFCLRCNRLGNLLIMLVRSRTARAVQEQQQQVYECCLNRVLLEGS